MAASLVAYPVAQVRLAIGRCDPGSQEWQSDVVAETLKLAKDVMPTLSHGWGGSAAVTCVLCWFTALAQVCYAIDHSTANVHTGQADPLPSTVRLLLATVFAVLPLVVLYDLAACAKQK